MATAAFALLSAALGNCLGNAAESISRVAFNARRVPTVVSLSLALRTETRGREKRIEFLITAAGGGITAAKGKWV